MRSTDKNCESQYQSPFNGTVASCDLQGSHTIHCGDGFLWRPEQEKPRYIVPKEQPVDKGPKTVVHDAPSASEKQVGGDHYGDDLQPIDVIDAWGLDFYEGSALKYLARHRKKNGREDIEKAIHYLELLLERQYNNV